MFGIKLIEILSLKMICFLPKVTDLEVHKNLAEHWFCDGTQQRMESSHTLHGCPAFGVIAFGTTQGAFAQGKTLAQCIHNNEKKRENFH